MATLVAMLCAQPVFHAAGGGAGGAAASAARARFDERKRAFGAREGDHLTLINVYAAYSAQRIGGAERAQRWAHRNFVVASALETAHALRLQLRAALARVGLRSESASGDVALLQRCITAAFFLNSAYRVRSVGSGGSNAALYRTLHARPGAAESETLVRIHPQSVLHATAPRWLLYHDVAATDDGAGSENGRGGALYLRTVSVADEAALQEFAAHFLLHAPEPLSAATAAAAPAEPTATGARADALLGEIGDAGGAGGGGGTIVENGRTVKHRRLF
jgi:hypothetical protein